MILVVPTIALDTSLIESLEKSIDFPITKVAINGGRPDALDSFKAKYPDWKIYHFGKNLGFSGSCNWAVELFPNEDSYLLCNDDGQFQPGCLKRMCDAAEKYAKDVHMIYVNENSAFDICVWTRKGIKDFGLFDENFYPAYYEDNEMRFRFSLSDKFKAYIIPPPFPVFHGKPRACGTKYHAMMKALKPINEDYMLRKWGSLDDKPVFKTPFNIPEWPVDKWSLEHDNRENREVICSRFWNQPKPSIYE